MRTMDGPDGSRVAGVVDDALTRGLPDTPEAVTAVPRPRGPAREGSAAGRWRG